MAIIVPRIEKFFSPHRKILQLFKENYSPDILRKITYAGIHSPSFETAHNSLATLGEFFISASHIQRLTIRVGKEFDMLSDQCAHHWEDIPEKPEKPVNVASVSVDGGRAQIRSENTSSGVHDPAWIETKVACLQELESIEHSIDPHPMLPRVFTHEKKVNHLVEGLKGARKKICDRDNHSPPHTQHFDEEKKKENTPNYRPTIIKRTALATVDTADNFGNLVFHKTRQQHLHTAKRKAFLGDGDIKIWTIFEDYFKQDGWCPILDFVHAIEYAFEAAKISTTSTKQCWARYIEFATHIWQGRVLTVIRKLEKSIDLAALSQSKSSKATHERLVKIRNYFKNHASKMNYPEYRKNGLPISSCHVESLIKQFNLRVKATDKFWNRSSLKGVLKTKAAYISDDGSVERFWENRYDWQTNSKRSYEKQAA